MCVTWAWLARLSWQGGIDQGGQQWGLKHAMRDASFTFAEMVGQGIKFNIGFHFGFDSAHMVFDKLAERNFLLNLAKPKFGDEANNI